MAHLFKNIIYNNKNFLRGSFIIANGNGICQIDPSGGLHFKDTWASSGSGSPYVKSFFTNNYKENMTAAQAMEMAAKAIATAIKFDKSSGGCIRMFNVCEDKTMETKFLDYYTFGEKAE